MSSNSIDITQTVSVCEKAGLASAISTANNISVSITVTTSSSSSSSCSSSSSSSSYVSILYRVVRWFMSLGLPLPCFDFILFVGLSVCLSVTLSVRITQQIVNELSWNIGAVYKAHKTIKSGLDFWLICVQELFNKSCEIASKCMLLFTCTDEMTQLTCTDKCVASFVTICTIMSNIKFKLV